MNYYKSVTQAYTLNFMKKNTFYTYLAIILLAISFWSCDDDNDPTAPDTVALLTNGVWVGTQVFENGDNKTEAYAEQNLDIRKLEIVFNNNERVTATYNDGTPDVGSWRLINDSKAILFQENTPDEKTGDIIVLTESAFRIKDNQAGLEMHFVKKEL